MPIAPASPYAYDVGLPGQPAGLPPPPKASPVPKLESYTTIPYPTYIDLTAVPAEVKDSPTLTESWKASARKVNSAKQKQFYLQIVPFTGVTLARQFSGLTGDSVVWKELTNTVDYWRTLYPNATVGDFRGRVKGTEGEKVYTGSVSSIEAELHASAAEMTQVTHPQTIQTVKESERRTQAGQEDVKKAFQAAQSRFMEETTPEIQEILNAVGALESGAAPEQLARALRRQGAATTMEQLQQAKTETLASLDPLRKISQRAIEETLQRLLRGRQSEITQHLDTLRLEAQEPPEPDILAQLLGVAGGVGTGVLLRGGVRRIPGSTPAVTAGTAASGIPY